MWPLNNLKVEQGIDSKVKTRKYQYTTVPVLESINQINKNIIKWQK